MKKDQLKKMIKEELNSILHENKLKPGDKIKVIKQIDFKLMKWLKSKIDLFYNTEIQPMVGDTYEVEDNSEYTKDNIQIYKLKNLNRPDEISASNGKFSGTAQPYIGPAIEWIDSLLKSGYIQKINAGTTLQENAVKRWVATVEMYIYGREEKDARQEAEDLIQMIDDQADNSPRLVDLVPQQFGKLGIGETKIPDEAGVIGTNKVNAFVTQMIQTLKELRDSTENIDDFIGKSGGNSTAQLLKMMKNPKLKEATIKYMQLEKKLNNLSPENQLIIAAKFSERYHELFDI